MNYLEFPNPQFIRKNFKLFNDNWSFSLDGNKWVKINVPYAPESVLSGLEIKSEINKCFYKNEFEIVNLSPRTIIHFGAVDYLSTLYINGEKVGIHEGGYTSFEYDISSFVKKGTNLIVLEIIDDDRNVATGKQTYLDVPQGTFYTRTTGIWEDVWFEYLDGDKINSFKIYPNYKDSSVELLVNLEGKGDVKAFVYYKEKLVGQGKGCGTKEVKIDISISETHLWEPSKGELYDIVLKYKNDVVYSYFGLRNCYYKGMDFYINDKKVFQKLVLDQGYNQKGLYTSPDTNFMKNDIEISLKVGFNGARLHQKVFEPKFLFLADKLGYLVWGEFPNWGVRYSKMDYCPKLLGQLKEQITRDFNHPCIITWCPLNETWADYRDCTELPLMEFVESVYDFVKGMDSTRPVIDTSGGYHTKNTDVFDFHLYEDEEAVRRTITDFENNDNLWVPSLYIEGNPVRYNKGTPVNYSEFGGIGFGHLKVTERDGAGQNGESLVTGWGYGKAESDNKQFLVRYKNLIDIIKTSKKISGFTYTQLYDIMQEQNGLFYYDRSPKLNDDEIKILKLINDSIN